MDICGRRRAANVAPSLNSKGRPPALRMGAAEVRAELLMVVPRGRPYPEPDEPESRSEIDLIGNPHCALCVAIIDAAGAVIVVGGEPADHRPAALAAELDHRTD
jgi:hypothetical protein